MPEKRIPVFLPILTSFVISVIMLTGCGGEKSPGDILQTPVADIEAASRAFKLYYKERVERAIVSYNRFMVFGGTTFGITIGKAGVSRKGDDWEVVPGPNDNNQIGRSVWTAWKAYKVFRTRTFALSLIRMFDGLVFLQSVSGHEGVTGRMAYPGWTMTIDGTAGKVELIRNGQPAIHPYPPDPSLEKEMIAAFYKDFKVTYRENPEDFLLSYMPAQEVAPYAITYSFSMLPQYLRVSDCCTSLMRTPAPYPWEGGFWGNHNSRDNFPDLGLGFVAAMEAMNDKDADDDLREAAARAWEAGKRVCDLIQANGGKIMTVDEHNPYDKLVVSGAVRPDGETESQDLGGIADCQMAYLARALSTVGLALPLPVLPAPGSVEEMLVPLLDDPSSCTEPGEIQQCNGLGDAYCGMTWGNIEELKIAGSPWLELVRSLEEENPGTGEMLLGSFQDDFHEKTLAGLALVEYARLTSGGGLLAQAIEALGDETAIMRTFADIIYGKTKPLEHEWKRYQAALVDAQAGLKVEWSELNDLAHAEQQMSVLESLLEMEETGPAKLLTDGEILNIVSNELSGKSKSVKERYKAAYGDTPPLRISGEGYEARIFHNNELSPWKPVETPRHKVIGGIELLEAIPLCVSNPGLLDCAWAALGCVRPDLDQDGTVDDADKTIFETASAQFKDIACGSKNQWCSGADLDYTGAVDAVDSAFMTAALGCRY